MSPIRGQLWGESMHVDKIIKDALKAVAESGPVEYAVPKGMLSGTLIVNAFYDLGIVVGNDTECTKYILLTNGRMVYSSGYTVGKERTCSFIRWHGTREDLLSVLPVENRDYPEFEYYGSRD